MNSREKGKRGERAAAAALKELGLWAQRGVQHAGGEDSPDIKTAITGAHFEVKRVEKGNVHQWMAQAIADAGAKVPVVMHRKNRTEWLLTVRLSDVERFATEITSAFAEVGNKEVPDPLPCQSVRPDEKASRR